MIARLAALTACALALAAPLAAQAEEHPMSVYHREVRQQNRIYSGVKNGSLSHSEYNHLQSREAAINRTYVRDKAHNGGTLTAGERSNLEARQNNVSRAIYRDKHN